ncbi:hypothetical protein A3K80_00265 [Candidatus Bathyarchaeota archaeon RBG_13_38_9]|nr:MAG: hypothetical protein A3K80_00265 [Candidatus Bathyarchaeota archaeon RBG_13_38_9]
MNSRIKSSAPQNIKCKNNHGGSRSGTGSPQRQPLPWMKNADLRSAKGFDNFLCYVIECFWKTNPLDARALGALNGLIKTLMELRQWCNTDYDSSPRGITYLDESKN